MWWFMSLCQKSDNSLTWKSYGKMHRWLKWISGCRQVHYDLVRSYSPMYGSVMLSTVASLCGQARVAESSAMSVVCWRFRLLCRAMCSVRLSSHGFVFISRNESLCRGKSSCCRGGINPASRRYASSGNALGISNVTCLVSFDCLYAESGSGATGLTAGSVKVSDWWRLSFVCSLALSNGSGLSGL